MDSPWVHMGTVLRPHGIRGDCLADWYADALPLPGASLWLRQGASPARAARLCAVRRHRNALLVSLEGVATRSAAEALRGAKLLVRRASLPDPGPDEAYVQDLLGRDVLLPDGSRLGRLDHVEYPAGREVWSILTDDGREVLFPARPEFLLDVADAVRIAPPEGLLDIYLAES